MPAPPPPPVGEVRPPREWPKQDPEPPNPQGMKIPSGSEVVIRSIPDPNPTPGEAWFERRLQRAEKMRDEAQTGTYKHGYWKGFVEGMIAALASFEMDRRRS